MPCSFCHIVGHNIKRCNSHQIEEKYNIIQCFYENTCRDDNNSGRRLFINFVNLHLDAITVKAIGLRYMGSILPNAFSIRNFSKIMIIEQLWETHFHRPLENVLTLVPDEVPAYAEDLLTWTIDRTPQRTFDNSYTSLYIPPYSFIFAEHEYIPLIPINLIQHFDAAATRIKYDINIEFEPKKLKTEKEKEEDCGICYELTKETDMIKLNCGHIFCGQCIKGCLMASKTSCAMCRCQIKNISVKNQEIYELVSEYCN